MTKKTVLKKRHVLLAALFAAVLCFTGCAAERAPTETRPESETVVTPAPTPTPIPEVRVGSRTLPADTERLYLSCQMSADELSDTLSRFPGLKYVAFYGGGLAPETEALLTKTFPDVTFRWDTLVLGRVIPARAREISFAGERLSAADVEELRSAAAFLPELKSVDLTGCGLDNDVLHALDVSLEGIDVIWPVSVYGAEFLSTSTEIDVSGIRVQDRGAQIEALLPLFPHLEKVVMSDCGLSDEEMDALNKKYDDVRFVWSVHFSIWSLRTDADNFIAARTVNQAPLTGAQCQVLRYCTDLIALDLGHKNVSDLSFLYDLPKLQYLILVENDINDITPIGSLSELKYLEIFNNTYIKDLSPLINCKKLEDLNICYVYPPKTASAFDTLMQMPWLGRLWCCGNVLTQEQIDALQANMPDCEMYTAPHGEPTGGGWREHPNYFEMRDVFGMYYMPGGTNGVDEFGHQIIVPG